MTSHDCDELCHPWKFSAYATGDSQDTVSMTPVDSHLLRAATGVQTLFIIIRVHHIAET